MKIKIFSYLLFLELIWGRPLAFGQLEPVDVRILVQEALISNPELHTAGLKWQSARARAVQAGVLEDPMVGVEFEEVPTDTLDIGRYGDIEWSFSQSIPFPGKLSLKRKMEQQEAQKAYLEYQEKEREIINRVKTAYSDFYLIHQTLKILQENKELLSQFRNIAQSKYEVGKVTQQDLLKAQVELAKVNNRILIAEQEMEAAKAKINMLLARNPQEPLGDPGPLPDESMNFELDLLLSRAIERRPELKGLESEIRGGEYGLRLAKREYWPNFFTRLESRQFQGTGLEEYDVMVGINIPWLWTRSRVDSGIEEAKSNLEAAQADYQAKKFMIFFEIKDALVKVKTSKSLVELYRTNILPKAEQTVKVSQTGYQTDKIDFLTLLDSQRSLLEFQLEYEEAQANYYKNLAELERNIGVDLMREGEGYEAKKI